MHGARTDDNDLGFDPILALIPTRRLPIRSVFYDGFEFLDSDVLDPAVGDDFDSRTFRRRQLHAMRALFGLVGTTEITEAGARTTLEVERKLFDPKPEARTAFDKKAVIVVEKLFRLEMNVVFFEVLPGSARDVGVAQSRNIPAGDDLFRNRQ